MLTASSSIPAPAASLPVNRGRGSSGIALADGRSAALSRRAGLAAGAAAAPPRAAAGRAGLCQSDPRPTSRRGPPAAARTTLVDEVTRLPAREELRVEAIQALDLKVGLIRWRAVRSAARSGSAGCACTAPPWRSSTTSPRALARAGARPPGDEELGQPVGCIGVTAHHRQRHGRPAVAGTKCRTPRIRPSPSRASTNSVSCSRSPRIESIAIEKPISGEPRRPARRRARSPRSSARRGRRASCSSAP